MENPAPATDSPPQASPDLWADLWPAIDRFIDVLDEEALSQHGLGPIVAYRLRALGRPVPELFAREERAAGAAHMVAPALLARACAAYDGPLVMLKGLEVAARYPARSRRFGDIDLLADDADAAQDALLGAGFRLQDRDWPPPGYDLVRNPHYHMHPLVWPGLGLRLEVHKRVKWPKGLVAPPTREIIEASVPNTFGVEGLLVPDARHQAVLLATHAWGEVVMRNLRELLDVTLFAAELDRAELARIAARWGFQPGWKTTLAVADWLYRGRSEPAAVKVWARYLRTLREPTVAEMHVQEWVSPFWLVPPQRALRKTWLAVLRDLRPEPHQTWGAKLRQTGIAILHPLSRASEHDRRSRESGVRPR
jgi:hypothetical protein